MFKKKDKKIGLTTQFSRSQFASVDDNCYTEKRKLEDEIFEMAYKAGEFEDYLCGIGAYDLQSQKVGVIINTDAIMHKIYNYYATNNDENLPKAFIEALESLTHYKTVYAVYVVMDITTSYLSAQKEGRATFSIDCTPIVERLRVHLKENRTVFSQNAEFRGYTFPNGVNDFLLHYEKEFQKYGYSILQDNF